MHRHVAPVALLAALAGGCIEQSSWRFEDRTAGACVGSTSRERLWTTSCAAGLGPLVAAARWTQILDAEPLRGRRLGLEVSIDAAPRLERAAIGRLIATAEGPDGVRLFRAESSGRPPHPHRVVIEVPSETSRVVVDLAAFGAGDFTFENLEIEPGALIGAGNLPPKPLSADELSELVAFSQLLGPVRWFSPAALATDLDWNRFAIAACDALLDPAATAGTLGSLLPWVRFDDPGPEDCDRLERISWLGAPLDLPMAAYRIDRTTTSGRRPWHQIELGNGKMAHVPIGRCAGDAPLRLPELRRPAGWEPSPADRATRLAAVALAWSTLEHFDPERAPGDPGSIEVLRAALNEAAGSATATTALEHLAAARDDGHALIGRPEGGREFRLPLAVDDLAEGIIVTAAAEDGIGAGDRLVSLDGTAIERAIDEQLGRTSAATLPHRRQRTLGALLHRPTPRPVALGLEGLDGRRREVVVAPRPAGSLASLDFGDHPPVTDLAGGRLLVDLRRVDDAGWGNLLPRLQAASALILDLRGYPRLSESMLGHFSTTALEGPQFCIPRRDTPGRGARECRRWQVPSLEPHLDAPVVVLTDTSALSYAETLLTMFAEHRLATIVGRPSAGTNGNFTGLWLPAGYRLYFTGMSADGPDGNLRGRGVEPDVAVHPTRAGIAAGRDEVLEAAIAWLEAEGDGGRD